VVRRGLAIAFDGDAGRHAFARGLAPEQIHHLAEHAGELHVGLLVGAHVGVDEGGGGEPAGQRDTGGESERSHAISFSGEAEPLDFTAASTAMTRASGGDHASSNRAKPIRSNRNPPSAGPASKPAPHARLYNPYATPKDRIPASDVASAMKLSDGVMTRPAPDAPITYSTSAEG